MKPRRLGAVLAVAVLAGSWGLPFVVTAQRDPDEVGVERAVRDFGAAVDVDDQDRLLDLLCAADAELITRDDDHDPGDGEPNTATPVEREVGEVRVADGLASARVAMPDAAPFTIHLRREGGAWKVCEPAVNATTGAVPSR